jgi:amino acid transporter
LAKLRLFYFLHLLASSQVFNAVSGSYHLCGFDIFFSVSEGFKTLAVLASGALLLIYLAVILAMIKLRTKKNRLPKKHLRFRVD